MPFRLLRAVLPSALIVAGLLASGPAAPASAQAPIPKAPDIVDTLAAAGPFATLTRALQVAGLVDALRGPGPFTLFAPTDGAFGKLTPGALDGLLKDPARLKLVLLYHVVAGALASTDVMAAPSMKTVEGDAVTLNMGPAGVTLNATAGLVKTDVIASNGVVHVIDTVLLPPSLQALSRQNRTAAGVLPPGQTATYTVDYQPQLEGNGKPAPWILRMYYAPPGPQGSVNFTALDQTNPQVSGTTSTNTQQSVRPSIGGNLTDVPPGTDTAGVQQAVLSAGGAGPFAVTVYNGSQATISLTLQLIPQVNGKPEFPS